MSSSSNTHTECSPDYLRITNWGLNVLWRRGWRDREEICSLYCRAQSMSVVRSAGDSWMLQICAPQPAAASHTYWKGWFMHSPCLRSNSQLTRSHMCACATQTHLDPKQGPRGLNTITFSSLLEGRKNNGATRRLLCPCGKTHGRLSQHSQGPDWTRPQLLNRKSPPVRPCSSSNPPYCLVGSQLREESQNWQGHNKVFGLNKDPSVCRLCKSKRNAEWES